MNMTKLRSRGRQADKLVIALGPPTVVVDKLVINKVLSYLKVAVMVVSKITRNK